MAVLDNSPGLKYIRVEALVVMFNDTMYPVKNIWTKKKYLYWDSSFPFILQESDVRPKETLSRFLIYINDNGFHKEIPNDAIKLIDGNKAGIIDPTSNKVFNAMKEDLSDTKQKYITVTETIDGITKVIGESERLDDSIVNKLFLLKETADGLTGKIEKIETSINDDYKEVRSKIIDGLAQYTFKSANHKEAITAIQLNKDIPQENKDFVNKRLEELKVVSINIKSALNELIGILTKKGDTTNIEIIQNAITTLNEKEKTYLDYVDTLMQKTQINTDDISLLLQYYNNLNNHVIATQATVDQMITLDLGDAFLKLTHDIVLANDRFNQTLTELKKEDGLLSEKYNLLEKTVDGTNQVVSKIGKTLEEVKLSVDDIVETSKTNVASVKRFYAKSSSNLKLIGFDFKGIKKGDLIFWGNKENDRYKGIWHVGIYYGTDTDGVEKVIECTSGSGVKLHTDGKSMGLVLSSWDKKNKKDIVCIARPHSSSANRVFSGANEFVALAKKYYDLRDKYITYGQLNITSDNFTRKWTEVTIKGADSTDGLYRFLDCSGFINLALRGITFEEVLQNKSVYDNKDMTPRTNVFPWAYGLPRLASDQCKHVEEKGWNLPIEDWHSDVVNWVETPTALDAKDSYIWEKTVTYYKDGTNHESLPICLTDSQINGDKQIVSSTEYYYESDSNIELVGGQWSTTIPTYEGDKYIWQKTLFLYSDDTSDWTSERCVSGISPRLLELITDNQVVPFTADGNPKSQTPITLTVLQRNYTENVTWIVTPSSVTLSGNATQKQLAVDNFRTIDRIGVKVTSGDLSDEVVICKVQDGLIGGDGEDAYTVLLTNSSHTFSGNDSTTIDGTTSCGVIAYKGATQISTTVGDIRNIPLGMSIEVANNNTMNTKLNISVTSSLTNKNGTVTIPITVDGKSFEQLFSFAIAFDGANGISVTGTTLEYGISNSPSIKPTQWTTEYQQAVRGQYIWSRLRTDFSNGKYTYSNEACISGMDGLQGTQGEKGQDGIDGKDGITYYTWVKYADDYLGGGISDNPTNKPYIGLAYNKLTPTESNDPTDYTWSLIKGADGIPGENGLNGKTYYTWIKYSDNADGSNPYDTPNENTLYIGIATNKTTAEESTDKTQYKWSKFKGSDGVDGTDGQDGLTTSFHIKYSNVPNPTESSQMTETPSAYIGTYVDYIKEDSNDPTKYTWSRFMGMQGEQGIPGINGENGVSSYLHTKYSNDGGKTFTSNNGEDVGTYLGTCVDNNPNDPNIVSSYKWSKIEGSEIVGMKSQYYLSTSKTQQPSDSDSGWKDVCPKWEMGKYIWTRVEITYVNPSSIEYIGHYVDTSWEAVNDLEIGGRNILISDELTTYTTNNSLESSTTGTDRIVSKWNPTYSGRAFTLKNKSNEALSGVHTFSGFVKVNGEIPTTPYFENISSYSGDILENYYDPTTGYFRIVQIQSSTNKWLIHAGTPRIGGSEDVVEILKAKLEKGNKATDYDRAPEDTENKINNVNKALGDLESGVKNAFGDGIINDSEAKALETHIQNLKNEKENSDKEYSIVYNNPNLSNSSAKTNLYNSKVTFDNANVALINTINSSIADKVITNTERTNVDNGFATYRTALGIYKQRIQEALDYISDKKDEDILSQITRMNLQRNTTFKRDLSHWVVPSGYTRDSTKRFENHCTIKFNRSGASADEIRYLHSGSNAISAEVGKSYSASCLFYTENKATIDSGGVKLAIYFYSSSGTTLSSKEVTVPFVNGSWETVKLENVIAPSNTTNVSLTIKTLRNGVYWLAHPKLEQGETCSYWSESPIDIETEFIKVEDDISRVETKADSITSLVGKNTRFGRIRYIRDYLKGSTTNSTNHWVEIQAYKDGVNIAKEKPVTCNGTPNVNYPLSRVTDELINDSWAGGFSQVIETEGEYKGWQYVQVDLGQVYTDINKIKVWHYFSDGRSYNHKLEVSEDGNEWYKLFDSSTQGTYAEKPNGKTYVIDGTYSESQIEQTSDKISWVVKNGTSASNMVLTPELYSVLTENIRLTAKNITIEGIVTANSNFKILSDGSMEAKNGKFSGSINVNEKFKVTTSGDVTCSNIDITGGSIDLNSGKFIVSASGATQIGGMSAVTYDGAKRAICEITNTGAIYSCDPKNKDIFTRIRDGAIMIHTSDSQYVNIDSVGIRVWDTTSGFATVYGDAYIGHNTSIMVDAPGLNVNGWVNATKYEGQNHTIIRASTDKALYLCCNGGDYGDDETTIGVRSIMFFKNTAGDYVFRSRSKTGACALGSATYPWGNVYGREFKNTSDRTLKENIKYLSNAETLDLKANVDINDMYLFVKNDLPLTLYNYIGGTDVKVGFIAQDIIYNKDQTDNIIGQLIVNPKQYQQEDGKLTYDLNNYVSVVAGALQKTIVIQEAEINERIRMQNEIDTLKRRLDNMGIQ